MESRGVDNLLQRDVLIVSATPLIRELFHDLLLAEGYECLLAADGREGIEMFRGWRPPLVLTDVGLPIMSGMELPQEVRQEDPDAAVVVVCTEVPEHGEDEVGFVYVKRLKSACLRLGAYAFLQTPISTEDLLLTTEGALHSRQMERSQAPALQAPLGCRPAHDCRC